MRQLCNNYLLTPFAIFGWIKFGVLVYLLSNDFEYIHISISGCWNFMGNDFGVQHNHILNESQGYLTDLPLVVYHPCGTPQMSVMNLSPHWPPQHTMLEILWLGLNINLCDSRAAADSQAHRTVLCGKFETHLPNISNQRSYLKLQICWIVMANMFIYTNNVDVMYCHSALS